MTHNGKNLGGRPRIFDEDELVARITSFEDLVLVEAALLEHSSHPTWARGCVNWLRSKKTGDPTGGIHAQTATRYRGLLAELPFDPLRPPGGRRRALRELTRDRGSVHFALLAGGAAAGALALAAVNPSAALSAAAMLAAPIIPVMSTCGFRARQASLPL